MIKVAVIGVKAAQKGITNYKKQSSFATAVALTKTAQKSKVALQKEMKRAFKKPSRHTLNSLFVKPAKKSNPTALVGFKDFAPKGTPAGKYLQPQVFGGSRPLKRHEYLLNRAGLLPNGMYTVPGSGYKRIGANRYAQILSDLRASTDKYQNRTDKKGKFFVSRGGRFKRGVYLRQVKKVKPVLIFVDRAIYKPRFKFYETVNDTWKKNFRQEYKKALNKALRTAR